MRRMTYSEDMTPMDKLCVEKGITRRELARQSGVPIRTIEGWAKRTCTSPNVYQLYKVAQVLGCHIEDLLELDRIAQGESGRA